MQIDGVDSATKKTYWIARLADAEAALARLASDPQKAVSVGQGVLAQTFRNPADVHAHIREIINEIANCNAILDGANPAVNYLRF